MQLSKQTINVFKNFASINPNLIIKPGNVLSTISAGESVFASANLDQEFELDQEFGIYDLHEFLAVMSLFKHPNLEFEGNYLKIEEGNHSVNYSAAHKSVLTVVPTIKQLPPADVSFELSADQLGNIQKVTSVLKSNTLSVMAVNGELIIIVEDVTNPSSTSYKAVIGECDKSFRCNINVENLKLLPGNYQVGIIGKRFCQFTRQNDDGQGEIQYFIAIELDSTFDY